MTAGANNEYRLNKQAKVKNKSKESNLHYCIYANSCPFLPWVSLCGEGNMGTVWFQNLASTRYLRTRLSAMTCKKLL